MKFTFLEHTADIKFKAFGKTLNDVFESCALAFSDYVSRGSKIRAVKKKTIRLEGKDNESLLYQFMDELVYLIDAEGFVVSDAEVKVKDMKLEAVVYGDKVGNYKELDHVKAATYAEMHVKPLKNGLWEAQVVLDV